MSLHTPLSLRFASTIAAASAFAALTACAMQPQTLVRQDELPAPIRVPDGHRAFLHTVGTGELTYECREKKDMAGAFEWGFVGPVATLADAQGQSVGKYYAGPTWEANDGSKVSGKQLAVSPHTPGSIPLQLVQAGPATGAGAMQGVSYIQRLQTKGGAAPALPCGAEQKSQRRQVAYQADYVFYRPAM
jgi:hypothetical protein